MSGQDERNPQVVTEHCPGGTEKLKVKRKGTEMQEGSQAGLNTRSTRARCSAVKIGVASVVLWGADNLSIDHWVWDHFAVAGQL